MVLIRTGWRRRSERGLFVFVIGRERSRPSLSLFLVGAIEFR